MSLKAFHIFFISLSAALALGFALWEINGFIASGDGMQLAGGLVSVAVAVGLVIYGIRFMRKLKHVRMI